jgi:2-polyprenyl-3-methyl-5-hydroxy-6-metoxy-1,4-benzoquinol methylase
MADAASTDAVDASVRTLEQVACNLCGADDARLVHSLPPFRIVECRRCGLAYTTPRLSRSATEATLYQDEYWEAYETQYEAGLPDVRRFASKWLAHIGEHTRKPPPWRICELGPGLGGFLAEAQAQGHSVYGVEPSAPAIRYATTHLGIDGIREGSIDTLPGLNIPPVDVFVMLAVIEHLHDPLGALRVAHDQLTPGGTLFLSTGVWRSFNHRLAGTAWSIIAPEEHLYYFSKRTIRRVLERADFEVADLRTNEALVNSLTKNRTLVRVFNNRPLAYARLPKLVGRLRLGDEMFVIASKHEHAES